MLQNISISNKCNSFKYPEIMYQWFPKKYEAAQLIWTLIIIRNIFWAANQHIRMISEGSCDTEDCSYDAENSALITGINYILKYIKIENSYFKLQ